MSINIARPANMIIPLTYEQTIEQLQYIADWDGISMDVRRLARAQAARMIARTHGEAEAWRLDLGRQQY
jgi:hypothetical protein